MSIKGAITVAVVIAVIALYIALDAAFMRGAQAACDQVNGYWNGQSCAVRP